MADLSERLEAAEAALRGFGQYVPVGDPNRAVLASCVATLREVLAHPEKLMGEPVAWADCHRCGAAILTIHPLADSEVVAGAVKSSSPTAPVVEAGATGWIAAHESGRIHHFSIADGWTVEVVTK